MYTGGMEFGEIKDKYKNILRRKSWFHGTSLANLQSFVSNGPLVEHNIGNELDFGYGFYLAPDLRMAERYSKRMIEFMEQTPQFSYTEEDLTPVVIEFEFPESSPSIFFEDHKFRTTCFPSFDEDFANFILSNRMSPCERVHDYDLIFGVMSDSNPNKLVPQVKSGYISSDDFVQEILKNTTSTRQLSIHNQLICATLVIRNIHYVKEGVVKHVEHIGHGQQ